MPQSKLADRKYPESLWNLVKCVDKISKCSKYQELARASYDMM